MNRIDTTKNNQLGSTLIGLMIAMVILGVTLTASTAFLTRNIRLSSVTANEIMASFLAEEGYELVKNIRDSADNFCLKNGIAGLTGFTKIKKNTRVKPNAYALDNSIATYSNAFNLDAAANDFNDTYAGLCLTASGTGQVYRRCTINNAARKFIRKIQILQASSDQGIVYNCQSVGTDPGVMVVSTVYWSEAWENHWPADPAGGGANAYTDNGLWTETNTTLHKARLSACLYNWRPN